MTLDEQKFICRLASFLRWQAVLDFVHSGEKDMSRPEARVVAVQKGKKVELTIIDPRTGRQAGPPRKVDVSSVEQEVRRIKDAFERTGSDCSVVERDR